MTALPLYDDLASVYDRWLSGDEAAGPCLDFYLSELRDETGPVLELGVGTGRIGRALAAAGVATVGLDVSAGMLARARRAVVTSPAGLPATGRPTFVRGVFQRLPFATGSFAAVILPMRTVGHLVNASDRRDTFAEVARVLRPGGRFVLDHYQLDRDWAEAHDGRARLMYAGPAEGREDAALLIWDRYDYDFAGQSLHCTVCVEEVGPGGNLRTTATIAFDFRWYGVAELVALANAAGRAVRSRWGDFSRAPLRPGSDHLILVLRKG
jgi:SAM-dependent methyltransferase